MLTLLLLAFSARLLANLTSAKTFPVFRLYLFVFIASQLFRWNYSTDAYVAIAVLVIKLAVTIETSNTGVKNWAWLFFVGIGVAFCAIAWGFKQQVNLLHPTLGFVKHIGQVFLAGMTLAIALFRIVIPEKEPFGVEVRHCWILTLMWMNYALVGVIGPAKLVQWDSLIFIWTLTANAAIILWLMSMTFSNPRLRLRVLRVVESS